MTRVDFYLLPDVDEDARHRFVCRLAHKAVTTGSSAFVLVRDAAHAAQVDELLWEYPDHQFLPHTLATDPDSVSAPLVIGFSPPAHAVPMLINLTREVPADFGRYERLAEIVIEPDRAAGRERYRYYREKGHALFHHELDRWEDK